MNFEQRVKSMSAKKIILAMVEGLRNPVTEIDMSTFGLVNTSGRCFGCAATNTICKINKKKFPKRVLRGGSYDRARFLNSELQFVSYFEEAIDYLRRGRTFDYNRIANTIGIAELKCPYF